MRDDDETVTAGLNPEGRMWSPEQRLGTFKRLVIFAAVIGTVFLLATTMPQADSAMEVKKVFAEHPTELAAGTELQGCIDNATHGRITPGQNDWLLEAIQFQGETGGLVYLELVGDTASRTSSDGNPIHGRGDCLVVRLSEDLKANGNPEDYIAMGKAEIVRVISVDQSTRSKFFKLGGEPRN